MSPIRLALNISPKFVACSALVLACASSAQAQLHVDIAGAGGQQTPIAIVNFAGDATPPQDLAQIVRDDLNRSGVFRTIDAGPAPIGVSDNIDPTAWKSRGADAVAVATTTRTPDGGVILRFRLFDDIKNSYLGGLEVTANAATLRSAAHRMSDYIYEKMTGERGIFSTHIAYVLRAGPTRYILQRADADGQNALNVLVSQEPIISPVWSPDGSRLAYVSFEKKKPIVYVQTIADGHFITASNFKGSNSAPAFSPDGSTLAVVLTKDGNSQIYLMNVDGSNARRLTHSSGIDTEPFFAPDGQTLYFTSDRGGGPQIYRMSLSGGDATRVTFQGDYNISPRVSPDGKSLAFVARREGRFQIHILDLASGQELPLTSGPRDESPSFAPNSRLLIYASHDGGRPTLAMVSADGSIRQKITSEVAGDVREPTWGPFTK